MASKKSKKSSKPKVIKPVEPVETKVDVDAKPIPPKEKKAKQIEKIKEELGIKDTSKPELTKEDYINMADQCERFRDAVAIGSVNFSITKFAIYYKDNLYLASYNRDTKHISKVYGSAYLTTDEKRAFASARNRRRLRERNRALLSKPGAIANLRPAIINSVDEI